MILCKLGIHRWSKWRCFRMSETGGLTVGGICDRIRVSGMNLAENVRLVGWRPTLYGLIRR